MIVVISLSKRAPSQMLSWSGCVIIGKFPLGSALMGMDSRPCLCALLIMHCSKSEARTNSRGDRVSPCLTPLLHSKAFPGTPLSSIDDDPVSSILCTHCTHLLLNPKLFSICRIELCSTVSKAFSKSNLNMTSSLFEC